MQIISETSLIVDLNEEMNELGIEFSNWLCKPENMDLKLKYRKANDEIEVAIVAHRELQDCARISSKMYKYKNTLRQILEMYYSEKKDEQSNVSEILTYLN